MTFIADICYENFICFNKIERNILLITIFSILLNVTPLNCQHLDTLKAVSRSSRTFDFRYESKNSFLNHDRVEITSLKFGLTFGRKLTLGAGYCWLTTQLFDKFKYFDVNQNTINEVDRRIKLRYFCYYVDYIYYKSKRWQYSLPTQFGVGYSLFSYKLNDSEFTSRLPIIFYEPGINVKYKFYTWLGVGATIGYRVALKTNRYLSGKLNSPLYSGGILIYWDQLAVAIFKKSKIVQKWLGPEEW